MHSPHIRSAQSIIVCSAVIVSLMLQPLCALEAACCSALSDSDCAQSSCCGAEPACCSAEEHNSNDRDCDGGCPCCTEQRTPAVPTQPPTSVVRVPTLEFVVPACGANPSNSALLDSAGHRGASGPVETHRRLAKLCVWRNKLKESVRKFILFEHSFFQELIP